MMGTKPMKSEQKIIDMVNKRFKELSASGHTVHCCRVHASAPELLEACQEMLVDYRQCGMENREVVSVVKSAIAKATGKEEAC